MANIMTGFLVHRGTKETFMSLEKAADYKDAVVFITGNGDASKSCIYAQDTYFANLFEFINTVNYVKGVNVEGHLYNAAQGGGYLSFAASDPAITRVQVSETGIQIGLTDTFINKIDTIESNLGSTSASPVKNGNAFERIAHLAEVLDLLTGTGTNSISGQITEAITNLETKFNTVTTELQNKIKDLESKVKELQEEITTEKGDDFNKDFGDDFEHAICSHTDFGNDFNEDFVESSEELSGSDFSDDFTSDFKLNNDKVLGSGFTNDFNTDFNIITYESFNKDFNKDFTSYQEKSDDLV